MFFMMVLESIRIAAEADMAVCMETLTRAFADDPVCNWAWPDRHIYREAFPAFCRAFGGAAFAGGTAHMASDGRGVALWLTPGMASDEEALTKTPLAALFEQMETYHPHEPHWRLPLIGVDPALQGMGIGSMLLERALGECDRLGMPAYLEATSPANARLYARHGFETIGRIQAGDSPEVLPMLRRPR